MIFYCQHITSLYFRETLNFTLEICEIKVSRKSHVTKYSGRRYFETVAMLAKLVSLGYYSVNGNLLLLILNLSLSRTNRYFS